MTSGRLQEATATTLPQPDISGGVQEVEMSTPLHDIAGLLHEVTLTAAAAPEVSIRSGEDSLEPGATVALTGTLDAGTAATYVWRQISGASVTITDGDTLSASYVAPATLDGAELVFGLRAKDSEGRFSPERTVTDKVQWATERIITDSGQVPAALYLVGS